MFSPHFLLLINSNQIDCLFVFSFQRKLSIAQSAQAAQQSFSNFLLSNILRSKRETFDNQFGRAHAKFSLLSMSLTIRRRWQTLRLIMRCRRATDWLSIVLTVLWFESLRRVCPCSLTKTDFLFGSVKINRKCARKNNVRNSRWKVSWESWIQTTFGWDRSIKLKLTRTKNKMNWMKMQMIKTGRACELERIKYL